MKASEDFVQLCLSFLFLGDILLGSNFFLGLIFYTFSSSFAFYWSGRIWDSGKNGKYWVPEVLTQPMFWHVIHSEPRCVSITFSPHHSSAPFWLLFPRLSPLPPALVSLVHVSTHQGHLIWGLWDSLDPVVSKKGDVQREWSFVWGMGTLNPQSQSCSLENCWESTCDGV